MEPEGHAPRGVHVCAALDEQTDNQVVSTRARDLEGEDAIDDRVHGLTVIQGVGDKAKVSRRRCRVEAKMWDYNR